MSDREDLARRLAEALGWAGIDTTEIDREHGPGLIWIVEDLDDPFGERMEFYNPDAPLWVHLAFVGRVAEALTPSIVAEKDLPEGWSVGWSARLEGNGFYWFDWVRYPDEYTLYGNCAPDLSAAAALAAIEARRES